jgi:hypothetical protein
MKLKNNIKRERGGWAGKRCMGDRGRGKGTHNIITRSRDKIRIAPPSGKAFTLVGISLIELFRA